MNTGFIGTGSMGGMLLRSLLRTGGLVPSNVWATNRTRAKLDALAAEFPGIHLAGSRQLAASCDLLFLCVKGGDTASLLAQMDPELYPGQLLVTTASTIPLKMLEDRVPCRVAKLMPSITQEIGAGVSLLIYGSRVTAEDRSLLEGLLSRISHPLVITESQGRPAIGLASGGPALIAYLLDSMAREAVSANPELSYEFASTLVRDTAFATLRLMAEGKMSEEEVIRRVATPGGMTEIGIKILSRHVPQAWQAVFRETAERERKQRERIAL
ncbi:MAG TPA: pyrroline-5-carboxylate reductase dimerization domain-containing protein [Terriglobales bacterium]|nr:pyrroline-5-carboxylate reductase dimerization domain-containing protein [Terriglobales bacterium]